MRSRAEVSEALDLVVAGFPIAQVAARLGIPRSTIRAWATGQVPYAAKGGCEVCGADHRLEALGASYVYLLGLYLGDGCLSTHPRRVFKLRLFLDARYPRIISSAMEAIEAVRGRAAGSRAAGGRCVELYSYWRQWPCHFPQHGPGPKHERPIILADWQQRLAGRWPQELVRGLIHSDGCRFLSTGRGGWSAPRYSFKNRSVDIHAIFRRACDDLGIRHTAAGADTTYVSRRADVAELDAFVGPKA